MRWRFFVLLSQLIASCQGGNNSPDKAIESITSQIIDTPAKHFRDSIIGQWRSTEHRRLTLLITPADITHAGILTIPYSLKGNDLIQFNPDNTVDTLKVSFRSDTLVCEAEGNIHFYVRF